VCEIFALGLVWSCGGDGGGVFSGCCLLVGPSVVLSLGLCLRLLWELWVLVKEEPCDHEESDGVKGVDGFDFGGKTCGV
jgi:hypothetical protein